jgi:hypothetical protein
MPAAKPSWACWWIFRECCSAQSCSTSRRAWAYLASAGATLLSQTREPLPGDVAHRHLEMPHPACIGWPAWTETLPRLRAGVYGCDDLGQPCSTERSAAGMRHFAHDLCAETGGNCSIRCSLV